MLQSRAFICFHFSYQPAYAYSFIVTTCSILNILLIMSLDLRCLSFVFYSSPSVCFVLYGSSSSASCLSTFVTIPRYKEGGFLHWLKSSPSLITCSPLPSLYVVPSLGHKSPPFPGTIIPPVPAFNLPWWPVNIIYRPVSWTRCNTPFSSDTHFCLWPNLVFLSLATFDPFLSLYRTLTLVTRRPLPCSQSPLPWLHSFSAPSLPSYKPAPSLGSCMSPLLLATSPVYPFHKLPSSPSSIAPFSGPLAQLQTWLCAISLQHRQASCNLLTLAKFCATLPSLSRWSSVVHEWHTQDLTTYHKR